jgi:hypothetical protein
MQDRTEIEKRATEYRKAADKMAVVIGMLLTVILVFGIGSTTGGDIVVTIGGGIQKVIDIGVNGFHFEKAVRIPVGIDVTGGCDGTPKRIDGVLEAIAEVGYNPDIKDGYIRFRNAKYLIQVTGGKNLDIKKLE